jgi:hypothetical protein
VPVYVDGRRVGAKADPGSVYDKMVALIMENPSALDISRFSEREMSYIRAAMSNIAKDHVTRILLQNPLQDLDMDRVFDVETCGDRRC